ncbi:MAG: hypothetical protein KF812_12105 [Fimbriimonadaceae bacterium]|nr:hypothetical protein [Fimbriimonadaceae bacterium]
MKAVLLGLLLVGTVSYGQDAVTVRNRLPLTTESSKVGDPVFLQTQSEIRDGQGNVLVKVGEELTGRVVISRNSAIARRGLLFVELDDYPIEGGFIRFAGEAGMAKPDKGNLEFRRNATSRYLGQYRRMTLEDRTRAVISPEMWRTLVGEAGERETAESFINRVKSVLSSSEYISDSQALTAAFRSTNSAFTLDETREQIALTIAGMAARFRFTPEEQRKFTELTRRLDTMRSLGALDQNQLAEVASGFGLDILAEHLKTGQLQSGLAMWKQVSDTYRSSGTVSAFDAVLLVATFWPIVGDVFNRFTEAMSGTDVFVMPGYTFDLSYEIVLD